MKLYKSSRKRSADQKGQMIIEYAVMFTIIVAVILYASVTYVRPALNNFFNTSSKVLKNATDTIEAIY